MNITYRYPGDPITRARLMFGYEFLRSHPNRSITIGTFDTVLETIPVHDICCDSCNSLVGLIDPCCLCDESRLYCWPCFMEWVKPHITFVENTKMGT